ncbi:MAG: HRDC domain-containing protein, partial [Desulfobulbia bacterium]
HLVHQGYLEQDVANYSILKLTERSWPLLRDEAAVSMARPRIRKTAAEKKSKYVSSILPDYDETLFDRLRTVRMELARQAGVPPFVIFHDRTLVEMAVHRPQTIEDMSKIHGVGANKCERYGALFIEEIVKFQDNR